MAVFKYRWNRILILLGVIFTLIFLANFRGNSTKNGPRRRILRDGPIKVEVIHSDRDREKGGEEKRKTVDLLEGQKCKIPRLDINGSEVINFFHTPAPLKCQIPGNFESEWVYLDEQGVIRFSKKREKAKCQMKYFWRETDDENRFGEEFEIQDGDEFDGGEYGSVTCYEGFSRWDTLLWNITPNQKAMERAKKMKKEKKQLNVYFLGFDSLSQMSFRRKLPKTVKFLEETMESVVLNGYNIVGDGPPQAFIPILTAQTETELPLTRKRFEEARYLDEAYPMIWKNFSDNGYVTMFAEDMHLYSTFTYRLKGFRHQPVDHYPRTFFKEVESRGDQMCINSQPIHKIWFEKSRQFMKVYKDVPRFTIMFQGLLSHDDINLVGQLEERMPFFSISLPKRLKSTGFGRRWQRNLKENSEKLTTPFDIHSTLLDILNFSLDSGKEETLPEGEEEEIQNASQHRSLSLFRRIPTDRTCAQAGIEPHWCTCLSWQNAMQTKEDRKLSRRIAEAVVTEINREISSEKDYCAPLTLSKIHESKKLLPEKSLLAYKNVKDTDGFVPDFSGDTQEAFAHFQLKIETIPGNAIYEITLFYDFVKDRLKMDFGAISHVNKYGDRPHCIIGRNFFLATFCVCFDKI
uniref:Uncharacterized protein n=1 Tax=Caenorhabditis tropicalis TaxID=1561998 RepID=A0A1I7UIR9_9PELO